MKIYRKCIHNTREKTLSLNSRSWTGGPGTAGIESSAQWAHCDQGKKQNKDFVP